MIFVNSCNLSKSSLMHVRRRVKRNKWKNKKKIRNDHGNNGVNGIKKELQDYALKHRT